MKNRTRKPDICIEIAGIPLCLRPHSICVVEYLGFYENLEILLTGDLEELAFGPHWSSSSLGQPNYARFSLTSSGNRFVTCLLPVLISICLVLKFQ